MFWESEGIYRPFIQVPIYISLKGVLLCFFFSLLIYVGTAYKFIMDSIG